VKWKIVPDSKREIYWIRTNEVDKAKRQIKNLCEKKTLAKRMDKWNTYTLVNT
jgi:hypothetical protein